MTAMTIECSTCGSTNNINVVRKYKKGKLASFVCDKCKNISEDIQETEKQVSKYRPTALDPKKFNTKEYRPKLKRYSWETLKPGSPEWEKLASDSMDKIRARRETMSKIKRLLPEDIDVTDDKEQPVYKVPNYKE